MQNFDRPIIVATRGSALALAQAEIVLAQCRAVFPKLRFELKVVKTTGDKLQTASLAQAGAKLPKGLFTKELEAALLRGRADMAVHSLKDLPTELPAGLELGAVCKRADARDVLIYRAPEEALGRRGFEPGTRLRDMPPGTVVATSSTRRRAQLRAVRPDLEFVELRGNVPTRLRKLAEDARFEATLLAKAGLDRLGISVEPSGRLEGEGVPEGLLAVVLEPEEMMPCVGQGAIGIEIRASDERMRAICARLNHFNSFQSVVAERAFLRAMGGGCQSPVAAYAEVVGAELRIRAVSFRTGEMRRAEVRGPVREPVALGERLAAVLTQAESG
ncbi:MAG: hydroxymethylbilane synthase [Verrucomicrobiae bacterium]|nr:hydroxymethylbilane synthase [Verrucomicrobiae bacterium]